MNNIEEIIDEPNKSILTKTSKAENQLQPEHATAGGHKVAHYQEHANNHLQRNSKQLNILLRPQICHLKYSYCAFYKTAPFLTVLL